MSERVDVLEEDVCDEFDMMVEPDWRDELAAGDVAAGELLPAVLLHLLAGVRASLRVLAREVPAAAGGWQDHEVVDVLDAVQEVTNLAAAVEQAAVAETDRRGLAEQHGATSTAMLLVHRARVTPAEARRRVATALACTPRTTVTGQVLPPLRARVAAGQATGELSPAHAAVIDRALNQLPVTTPVADVDAVEATLVELAHRADPTIVARAGRHAVAVFDPDGAASRAAEQARRRGIWQHQRPDGMSTWRGVLTPEVAAQLSAVLDPLSAPVTDANGDDTRTPAQRRHDALADVCHRLLRSGTLPDSGGAPTTVAVTIPLDVLEARAGHLTTSLGLDLELDPAALLHLCCEADLVPVVLDRTGGVLTYGRDRRFATPAQTQALRARDGGCTFPGCDRPPEWCERHHVIAWLDHGPTDIDNLALLCGHHHRVFQRWGWTCTMTDGRPWWTPPPHLDPHQTPLRNTRFDPPALLPPVVSDPPHRPI